MRISVVVPVRDEEKTIRELLECLINQTRKPDEIVITDGGSVDATREIIRDFIQKGMPVRLVETDNALPGRGRNLAANAAQFEWLAFIDAGVRPDKNWLELLARKVREDVDVVYGSWEPIADTFFKECAAIAYLPAPIQTDGTFLRPRSIASGLMKREVWSAAGGFPEHLRSAEDLLFMNQVEANGARVVFEPAAVVHWQMKPTFVSTFLRFLTYSRNNIRAGLWRQWQAAILSRYFVLLLLLLPAVFIGWLWLPIPILLWLAMLIARGVVALRRNRLCYPASLGRNLKRLLVLMPLIAMLDAASILGTLHWFVSDYLRKSPIIVAETGNGT